MASFGGIDSHTLTLLGDGRLVAIGGGVSVGVFNTATLGTISGGNSLYTASGTNYPIAVGYTAAVKLSDGRLLVVGGTTANNLASPTASAYFGTFTPGSNVITWTAGTPLPIALGAHTLTVLADGRVLVIGGNNGTAPVSNTYLGTITSGSNTITWAAGTPYPFTIEVGQAALLSDGRVFVTGGLYSGGALANTYFGSITSGSNTISWAAGTNLPTARYNHTMVLLSTGQVLIVGGGNASGTPLNSTYFGAISGNTVTWNSGTNLPTAMLAASAVVMPDNSVILAGGISAYGTETPQAAQELTISGTTITYTTTTTGSGPVYGSGAMVFNADSISGVAAVPITASGSTYFKNDVMSASATVEVLASGAMAFNPDVMASSAKAMVLASGAMTFNHDVMSSSAAVQTVLFGAMTFSHDVMAATATAIQVDKISITCPSKSRFTFDLDEASNNITFSFPSPISRCAITVIAGISFVLYAKAECSFILSKHDDITIQGYAKTAFSLKLSNQDNISIKLSAKSACSFSMSNGISIKAVSMAAPTFVFGSSLALAINAPIARCKFLFSDGIKIVCVAKSGASLVFGGGGITIASKAISRPAFYFSSNFTILCAPRPVSMRINMENKEGIYYNFTAPISSCSINIVDSGKIYMRYYAKSTPKIFFEKTNGVIIDLPAKSACSFRLSGSNIDTWSYYE